jgi:hypothetical protein
MRANVLATAGAVGFLLLSISGGARAADAPRDRACLNGFVDQYLAALVARDPSKLPLTKTARYTENGQTLKLGDGMWGPVITIGTYKLYFADAKAGQLGFFGGQKQESKQE